MDQTRAQRRGALLAGSLIGATVVLSTLSFAASAGAQGHGTHRATTTTTTAPPRIIPPPRPPYLRANAGMAFSTLLQFNSKGQLVVYGNRYVKYYLPPDALIPIGEALYAQNCQACHGVLANGVPPPGTPGKGFPNLIGLGPATYDFWIESGRMPAASTTVTQAPRGPAKLNHMQAIAISAYLNSLQPATPYLPYVNLKGADLSDGAALFALNCAACHTITGDGDALAYKTFAPSMRNVPATQVAEALRTGPANMPVFTGNLTDRQLRDVVAYVTERIEHPQNPGGIGLGGLGPVGEGFIGLALGVGLLALLGFWVGDRT
jgi:ubiquinol-cytochrome c reductase cytochrome c subunit